MSLPLKAGSGLEHRVMWRNKQALIPYLLLVLALVLGTLVWRLFKTGYRLKS